MIGPQGYFETLFTGQPWFVAVYGNFGGRSAATQAIRELPGSLRSLQPWVRSMGDIQADIRQLNAIDSPDSN
jgi:DamX protein